MSPPGHFLQAHDGQLGLPPLSPLGNRDEGALMEKVRAEKQWGGLGETSTSVPTPLVLMGVGPRCSRRRRTNVDRRAFRPSREKSPDPTQMVARVTVVVITVRFPQASISQEIPKH